MDPLLLEQSQLVLGEHAELLRGRCSLIISICLTPMFHWLPFAVNRA